MRGERHPVKLSLEAQLACEIGAFMERLVAILDFVFGCHHGHLSRVFTIKDRTYQVCCDCGAKFDYSLASMSIERPVWAWDARRSEVLMETLGG